jgi:hypothetical protein
VKPLAISAREFLDVGVPECHSSVFQVTHSAETNGDVLRLDQVFLGRTELAVSYIASLLSLDLHLALLEHNPEIAVHTHTVFFGGI